MAQETATQTKRLLDELGVRGFIKTTGNRGLHVYVRLAPDAGQLSPCAPRRSPWPASWSDAGPT